MRTDLSAMFWKEGRENLRWATLILLCLSASLAYAVYYELGRTTYNNSGDIPVWNSADLVFTIAAPLAGLALGLLQILPELRRDQWAFLVHRPATRTTLFFGKVVPGLCLYLLAVSLPLLGLAAWDAAPGHVAAPFDFRFTLSGWAAILTGLPFYFAGLLTALRPARWFGSRPLPVVAALTAPLTASWYGEFWQVAVFCLASAAVFCLAAWGSFASSGDYDTQPKPARFALGVTAYAGILGVTIAGIALAAAVQQTLFPQLRAAYRSAQYQIDTTGRILRVTQDGLGKILSLTDLFGHPVPFPVGANAWGGQPFQFLQVTELASLSYRQSVDRYSQASRYIVPLRTFLYHHDDTAWYYVCGTSQVVGYSEQTRLPISYLGPQGFSQSSAAAGRFPEHLGGSSHENNEGALLQFPHSVYRFDTDKETLTKLWPNSVAAHLEGACFLTQENKNNSGVSEAYIIAASGRLQAFADTGKLLFDAPRVFPVSAYPILSVAISPSASRFYFWYAPINSSPPYALWSPSEIVTVNTQGRTLKATSLPALDARPNAGPTPAITGALLPPGLNAAYAADKSALAASGDLEARRAWYGFRHDAGLGGVLALSTVFGLLAAALTWLICRRCGDAPKNRLLWAFGVFWLGGYGVLLLLALRAWPARVVCPICGRLRVVDRSSCEHCGAQFARPVRDGTEIFEAAAA